MSPTLSESINLVADAVSTRNRAFRAQAPQDSGFRKHSLLFEVFGHHIVLILKPEELMLKFLDLFYNFIQLYIVT